MSRAYRIRISDSIEQVIHVEDGVRTRLELLPVLPAPRLEQLLAEELGRRGFVKAGADDGGDDGKSVVRVEPDGVRVSVELATGNVTVSLAGDESVKAESAREAATPDESKQGELRERLEARVAADLERQVGRETERVQKEITARLEKRLRDLGRELDGVTNRVTADALKERARQIGEIEELTEDAATGELTIKVRV